MNNSIQLAQEITGNVTSGELLAHIKKGNRHFMHARAVIDRPAYSDAFIFRFSSVKETLGDHSKDITTAIDIPGFVSNGNTSERVEHKSLAGNKFTSYSNKAYRPLEGFWSLWMVERIIAILELLPKETPISFYVWLDHGTNELAICADCNMNYHTEKGLHGDALYLLAETKRGAREFLIDYAISAHNTGRFGYGKNEASSEG